jgi:hypothetical protein
VHQQAAHPQQQCGVLLACGCVPVVVLRWCWLEGPSVVQAEAQAQQQLVVIKHGTPPCSAEARDSSHNSARFMKKHFNSDKKHGAGLTVHLMLHT